MSFQAMTWATEQDLKTNEKMVLVMLANRCNHDTGRCDPSHKRLAQDCGMSLSTLKRCIERLSEQGMLTIEHRSQDGVNLPNQYHLHIGVSSQRTYPAASEPGVGSDLPGGVGSQRPEGWVHSELQTSNLNQEVKPVSKPLTDANKSAPGGSGVSVPAVLSKQKQPAQTETAFQLLCRETWRSYGEAYFHRYGIHPVRNAKVNAQVKQLAQRLGSEAPDVAGFYVVSVNESFVVRKSHELGTLVSNAEGYRTQWATGHAMTNTRARQIDSTQANASAADEAIAMLRAKHEREGRQ
ncbi:replication initiation protein [Erwinia phage Pavtok]|uniref:Putative helix-turn-helix domain-containing protein n=1 Tax=Erwinia phage Pavtok TaxID=2267655 RepID=A0A345BM08_9CAUD|nr:replication initiation protein [Erwinia phage Pavtok]AXF51479.1 putative helix-turn-helix domain-containing protein [Erwinia phage Pavtok]